ncbi:hypothetical protein [Myxococcus sp. AM009]|nr:hypothetical protein [Myxococcus sp. AM009]
MERIHTEFPEVALAIFAGGQGRRLSGVPKGLLSEAVLRAVEPSLQALANVNTPEDLARYGVALPSWRG